MKARIALAGLLLLAACSSATTATTGDGSSAGETGTTTGAAGTTSSTETPGMACWSNVVEGVPSDIEFEDVTEEAGLVEPLTGMHGHAAIWTDVNGDSSPDLYVGTFADREQDAYQYRGADGASPDRLLNGTGGGFAVDDSLIEAFTRTSGGTTADLDGDGDLDLVISRNIKDESLGEVPTQILENDAGSLQPVEEAGIPPELGARSVGVLDYDRDGLLDLFIVEDRFTGGSSVLLHNDGDLSFRDVTTAVGLPQDVFGLGVVVADFDNDGHQDIFVSGSNRLFMANGSGGFEEADSGVFAWEVFGDEDDVAGASAADVNRDGLLDLAIGQHYNSTIDFGELVPVRLYLNRGDGRFEDVTEAAGLTPLPTKAPHVELNDFDNDGWPDLLTSASADGGPALFRHQGLDGDIPTFATPSGLGDAQYWIAAPSTDFDHDGRLDIFMVEWEPALPSLLMRNTSEVGHWLQVSVSPDRDFGVGWRVEIFDGDRLIGARDITVTEGYSSGVLPIAHFGLGDLERVRVVLTPPGEDPIQVGEVTADQHIRWPDGCG